MKTRPRSTAPSRMSTRKGNSRASSARLWPRRAPVGGGGIRRARSLHMGLLAFVEGERRQPDQPGGDEVEGVVGADGDLVQLLDWRRAARRRQAGVAGARRRRGIPGAAGDG